MISEITIKNAQFGNQEAIEKIFYTYKNFIFMKSKNYFLNGADKEDIIQEGMIGLLKAINAFDSKKNTSFNTFASLCIKRQIISAIKHYNTGKNKFLNEAESTDSELSPLYFSCFSKNFEESSSPESIYINKEKFKLLKIYIKKNFSNLELEVFKYMVKGYSYLEIASITKKTTKNIDNTLQRIKKKLKFFESNYSNFSTKY